MGKNTIQVINSQNYSPTRARSFKIKTTSRDYSQYVNTIKAYTLAGLPFDHIANAGDYLGDEVEKLELDAPVKQNWKEKIGEIAEDEGKIMAWQSRGETTSLSFQLPQAATVIELEVAAISREVTVSNQDQKIDVVEGIAVVRQDSSRLENNIFLKAPAKLGTNNT